jgi:hypothetical protein
LPAYYRLIRDFRSAAFFLFEDNADALFLAPDDAAEAVIAVCLERELGRDSRCLAAIRCSSSIASSRKPASPSKLRMVGNFRPLCKMIKLDGPLPSRFRRE